MTTFLVLYMDDILLIGNDISMLTSVKTWLSSTFFMKDLGKQPILWEFRSIEINQKE